VIVPIVMCGGAGTRLWPLSRRQHPKQFLKLYGEYSPFQEAIRRARKLARKRAQREGIVGGRAAAAR
jgi:mannose-1-phosphate guanylyltransferase